MLYEVRQDIPGRLRLRCGQDIFDEGTAAGASEQLLGLEGVDDVMIRPANGSILVLHAYIVHDEVLQAVSELDPTALPSKHDDHAIEKGIKKNQFVMDLLSRTTTHFLWKLLPPPLRIARAVWKSMHYISLGLKSLAELHLGVEVLDATAIAASIAYGSYKSASTIMFLLEISSLLQDYTRKKMNIALQDSLALQVESVWILGDDGVEIRIPLEDVKIGDAVCVRTGSSIPVDGVVQKGVGEVNEASLTGESRSVVKEAGSSVYAGTVLEEGEIVVEARSLAGKTRIAAIVQMIDDSESLKAAIQGRAEHLADAAVPFSLLTFLLVLLFTRNMNKAMSVLMVDYSCAIKLATPIAVMAAMREASSHGIVFKGGKYLEAMADTDVVVFDKTGTLTTANPRVSKVLAFGKHDEDELLRIAACLEEHFPHSVARSIVDEAAARGCTHEDEGHAQVEYVVAHGIASKLAGQRVCLGSAHFIFDDEGVKKPRGLARLVERKAPGTSPIYLAIADKLAGVICIVDEIRPEAKPVIQRLHECGIKRVVMLTGDSQQIAQVVSEELGIDEYRAQVLPEDKALHVRQLHEEGHVVAMVGDGINDSPALAEADVSIAMSDASDIARMVSDVSILDASLDSLVTARDLSVRLMSRIDNNYRFILGFNSALIIGGIAGVLQPTMSAFLHNAATLGVAAAIARPLLPA